MRRDASGPLAAAVTGRGTDVGIALDGDADRLIAVDHDGRIVDGDHIIAMCADDLRQQGRLEHDTVVVTVMTNLGFRLAMRERGINVVETAVGDRYVLEALATGGYTLGGEQSGHVVFTDLATTGDGVVDRTVCCSTSSLVPASPRGHRRRAMTALPQMLVNVRVSGTTSLATVLPPRSPRSSTDSGRRPCARASVGDRATRPGDGRSPTAAVARAAADTLADAITQYGTHTGPPVVARHPASPRRHVRPRRRHLDVPFTARAG